jgi:hypothetical protein
MWKKGKKIEQRDIPMKGDENQPKKYLLNNTYNRLMK